MSRTVINAIFKGELLPWETKSIKTPRHAELLRKIDLEREHFEEEMSPHEKGWFDQYNCLINERANEEIGTTEYDLFMLGMTLPTTTGVALRGMFRCDDWRQVEAHPY